jgi:hypothetical protein
VRADERLLYGVLGVVEVADQAQAMRSVRSR